MECVIFNTDNILCIDVTNDREMNTYVLMLTLQSDSGMYTVKVAEGNVSQCNDKLNALMELINIDIEDI